MPTRPDEQGKNNLRGYEMCGIMGYVKTSKMTELTVPAISGIMRELEVRGRHATGVATMKRVKGASDCVGAKAAIRSPNFLKRKEYKTLMAEDFDIMIGHTRYATSGSPKKNENNHPFATEDGRYWLVHNGIVRRIAKDLKRLCKTECDSEAILRLIERDGIVKAFKRMVRVSTMDYAIMVIDAKKQKLYLARNHQRPLFFCNATETHGGYLFASTREIMAKGGLGLPEDSEIKQFRSFVLYSIGLEKGAEIEIEAEVERPDWARPTAREYVENIYEPYWNYYRDGNYENYQHYSANRAYSRYNRQKEFWQAK